MTNKKLYVLGGGGHAKVVIDSLVKNGSVVSGVIDPRLKVGDQLLDILVVGGDELMSQLDPQLTLLANGVGATANSRTNRKLYDLWSAHGFSFATVVHPTAIIANEVRLALGCQIMAGTVLQPHVTIGKCTVINTAASVDHDCEIGDYCFIAPMVNLCGGAKVGEGSFIGAGAVLLPGVKVGKNVLIAAGAVVNADVADGEYIKR